MQLLWTSQKRGYRFNPRPPFRTGAMVFLPAPEARGVFQSSPALSDGRYNPALTRPNQYRGFNPRPPFRTGAIAVACFWRLYSKRFNPRPPFRTGAISSCASHNQAVFVSILARPFGRALSAVEATYIAWCEVSILARPFGRALWALRELEDHYAARFNPRPPFRTGAIIETACNLRHDQVSILARPFGRAL